MMAFDRVKNGFYMTDLFTVEKVGHHKGTTIKVKGK